MEQPPSDLTRELARSFFALLMRHRAYFQSHFSKLGLSATQVQLIQYLSEGSMTMRDLAEKSACEPSNLTGLIDKLEAKHFVQRRVDRADRRIKRVSLTRTGKAFRDKLMARLGEPVPWMTVLTADDQQQLLGIIGRALSGLATMPSKDD